MGGRPRLEFIHVKALPFLPSLVLLGQQGADQAQGQLVVGEDADHPLPAANLLVQPLLHVRCAQTLAALVGQRHHYYDILESGFQAGYRLGRILGEALDEFPQTALGFDQIGCLQHELDSGG